MVRATQRRGRENDRHMVDDQEVHVYRRRCDADWRGSFALVRAGASTADIERGARRGMAMYQDVRLDVL